MLLHCYCNLTTMFNRRAAAIDELSTAINELATSVNELHGQIHNRNVYSIQGRNYF
uniref:Uncharacterized protein n=1 Tax=Meloidogyne incognita TaxID=6306 RepID=A0A914LZ23_MELIC